MPIYEYSCEECGTEFELLVRSDTKLECPTCQSTQLEKQLSVFATAESGQAAAAARSMAARMAACLSSDRSVAWIFTFHAPSSLKYSRRVMPIV